MLFNDDDKDNYQQLSSQLLPSLDFRIREGRISQWLSTGTELILN